MENRIKSKVLLFTLLLSTFLYGKIQGGFVSWFLFYSLLSLILYVWAVSRYALKDIRVHRTFSRPRLTAGGDLEVEITIQNRSSFPIPYLLIEDDQPEKLSAPKQKKKNLIYPWFRSKSVIRYQISHLKRGIYRWDKIELMTGDLFGFIRVQKVIPLPGEVMVYPKTYSVQKWQSENEKNSGTVFSQNQTSEDAASLTGVREYRIGDRFHRIHWKQTAKTMRLMTKEFERFVTNDFMFILDQEKQKYTGFESERFETAVELTASLVKFGEEKRFMTGLLAEGGNRRRTPLARGPEHLMNIYEILAVAEPDSEIPFPDTVLNEIPYLPFGTTVVLITPILDHRLYQLLAELSIRKMKTEVMMITGREEDIEGPKMNLLRQNGIAFYFISSSKWGENHKMEGLSLAIY